MSVRAAEITRRKVLIVPIALAATLGAALLTGGCGQRGPLYLPEPTPDAQRRQRNRQPAAPDSAPPTR